MTYTHNLTDIHIVGKPHYFSVIRTTEIPITIAEKPHTATDFTITDEDLTNPHHRIAIRVAARSGLYKFVQLLIYQSEYYIKANLTDNTKAYLKLQQIGPFNTTDFDPITISQQVIHAIDLHGTWKYHHYSGFHTLLTSLTDLPRNFSLPKNLFGNPSDFLVINQ